jgi:hypothetical protein
MLIVTCDVERVLADIDANHGDCSVECLDMACSLSWAPWLGPIHFSTRGAIG